MLRWICTLLLLSVPALAADVYVNGVNVSGVTDQVFEKVTVRIDQRGDVHIDAPGYSVKKVNAGPSLSAGVRAAPAQLMSRQYFLVTEQAVPGMAEYDVELFINGKYVRTMRSAEEQIVADVSKYLRPGANAVTLQAKKVVSRGGSPKSRSPEHFFRVIIGEGQSGGDHVVIENPLIRFDRTAAEQADVVQEFTLTTR